MIEKIDVFDVQTTADKKLLERIEKSRHDINYLVKNGQMEETDALELWEKPLSEREKLLDEIFGQADLEVDRMRENSCEKPHNNYEDGDKKGIDNCLECQIIKEGI